MATLALESTWHVLVVLTSNQYAPAPEQHKLNLIILQPQLHKQRQHGLHLVRYANTAVH